MRAAHAARPTSAWPAWKRRLCAGALLAAVYLPDLAAVLKVADPGGAGWGVVIAMSLLPVAIGQILNRSRVG